MSTAEALKKLTSQQARQVYLVTGGEFSALVTYDAVKEELVFRLIGTKGKISMRALLFHTEPAWIL